MLKGFLYMASMATILAILLAMTADEPFLMDYVFWRHADRGGVPGGGSVADMAVVLQGIVFANALAGGVYLVAYILASDTDGLGFSPGFSSGYSHLCMDDVAGDPNMRALEKLLAHFQVSFDTY